MIGLVLCALFLGGSAACTVFNDLRVPASTEGNSGMGGAEASSSTTSTGGILPGDKYMNTPMGARLCTHAFQCPELARSIGASLGVPIDTTNFSQCMQWASGALPPDRIGFAAQRNILKCIAGASGCDGAFACLPRETIAQGDPDCDDGASKCLDSKTSVDCAARVVSHCAADGFAPTSQCSLKGAEARCVVSSCSSPGLTSCEGDTLSTCYGAGLVASSCSASGLTCTQGATSAACVGVGSCSLIGAATCSGDVLHVCDGDTLSTFHCETIGATCVSDGKIGARCEPAGTACTPTSKGVNVCSPNNKSITVCIDGTPETVDCPIGKCQNSTPERTAHCG